jgi:hypothetical protein
MFTLLRIDDCKAALKKGGGVVDLEVDSQAQVRFPN